MKSKKELLGIQDNKKEKEFQGYVKIMDDTLKKNYPTGLDFGECPYVERIVYYDDVDISYYTGLDKILIKAIKATNEFKKIAKELTNKGYEYKLDSQVSYPYSKAEWIINLIIR